MQVAHETWFMWTDHKSHNNKRESKEFEKKFLKNVITVIS